MQHQLGRNCSEKVTNSELIIAGKAEGFCHPRVVMCEREMTPTNSLWSALGAGCEGESWARIRSNNDARVLAFQRLLFL